MRFCLGVKEKVVLNLTVQEIINALPTVSYGGHSCNKCKYKYEKGEFRCGLKGCRITRNALDLINRLTEQNEGLQEEVAIKTDMLNRQKAEIERLQERSERAADNLKAVLNERADHTEAIKDFSEEYKDHIKSFTGMFSPQLGFAVSLDAVLNAVDFVCENYKKN